MSETNKNKKETISKEFINMEIENEEFKKESKDSNLVSGLSEIAQSNQISTKAQSSLVNEPKINPKEDTKEKKPEEKISIIHLEEKTIPLKNNNDESNNTSKPLDPQYQNDIDECLQGKKDLSSQILMPMEEENDENNHTPNPNLHENNDYFGDDFFENHLENHLFDNRNLIPIQKWERPDNNKIEKIPENEDEKLNEKEFNIENNGPQPHILFEEEEHSTTINYDDIANDDGYYGKKRTNYTTEDDQG